MAGDVEQDDERQQLGGGEAVAFFLGLDECRQQILAQVVTAVLDDLAEVGAHVPGGDLRCIERGIVGGRFQRGGERLRPLADLFAAIGGQR